MPSKKKRYNAKFPTGRIKKIMQSDEEIGKVAQAVPVIISRVLELFIKQLLEKSAKISSNRNAKTLLPSHMKQCIFEEGRFDFLRDLVRNVPDVTALDETENNGGGGGGGGSSAAGAAASSTTTTTSSSSSRSSARKSRSSGNSSGSGVSVANDVDDDDVDADDDDEETDLVISTDSDAPSID